MKRKAMISLCLCLCMQFSGHAQDYDASKLKQRVDVYMNKGRTKRLAHVAFADVLAFACYGCICKR